MRGRFVAVVLAISCATLGAQSLFRTSVQYVSVDVVVTDKDDKPITDLKREDFEVTESGKPQSVADFQFVSIPAVDRQITVNGSREPEPDVASNTAPTKDSRLFVILVDDLHLLEQDLIRLKRTLMDLVNSFSPDDEVALTFVSHSNLGVNFTRNPSRLVERIDNVKAALGFGLDALAHVDAADPDAGAVSKPARFKGEYALQSMLSLKNVIKAMSGSDHTRRAIFFVTGGTTVPMFTDPDAGPASLVLEAPSLTMQTELLSAFSSARGGNVPVYVIDPRGNIQPEDAFRGGMGGSITSLANPALRAEALHNIRTQHHNMAAIAVNTGGRAIFNAEDMTRMVREVVQENGSYYLLGYYPEPFVSDGKFHEIKVHVKRPGVRVRARNGYDAPSSSKSTASLADTVGSAVAAGVNVSGLPLRAFAEPIATNGKETTVAVTVEVTYPAPLDGSKRFDDNLELKLVALDPDAKVKASSARTQHFTGAAPATGTVSFLINDVLVVPQQTLTLRVAVGSQSLGKAGMIQLPIEMPKESKGLTMSGIAVGFAGPPREAALAPDAFATLIPFQPTTSRIFAGSDVLRLFGHVYWKDKGAKPAVSVTLTGPAGSVNSAPALSEMKSSSDQEDAVIAAMLPLNGLAAGKYHLAVSATLAGGKPVTRDVLFEVK